VSTAYLIGKPVQHSMSPAMHNAAFAALGLPHRYTAVEVDEADLRATIGRWRTEDTLGGNVTIPHKEAVLRMMDEVDDEARAIGAVNTVIRRGSRLVGANTDAYGFARSIEGVASGGTVLVLGAGGAARACVRVLLQRGDTVLVANRSAARAEALARAIEVDGRRPSVVPWPPRGRSLGVETVVNATPLGLHGEDPLEDVELPANVVDIVPTAAETPLVKRARSREHGAVVDGLAMLLHQAARAFGLWTGVEAPLAVMRAALPRSV
jgi:shikimate dehydrogenase